MLSAVLLPGYDPRQRLEAGHLAWFLRRYSQAYEIVTVPAWKMSNRKIERALRETIARMDATDVLLISIHAHGSREGGWSFRKFGFYFLHPRMARILQEARCRIFLINSSCYAGRLVKYLTDARIDSGRVGLIAASEADTISYTGDLIKVLISDWRRCRIFEAGFVREEYEGGPPSIFGNSSFVYDWACRIWPCRRITVYSMRWGAVLDPLLW